MNIIIADDETISGIILQKLLMNANENVIGWARDGLELVEMVKKHIDTVDMVFTDIMMPNMNGLEAAREIKKLKKDIIVVAVTCVEHGTYIIDSKHLYVPWTTCDLFLRKPVDYGSLKSIIRVTEDALYEYKRERKPTDIRLP